MSTPFHLLLVGWPEFACLGPGPGKISDQTRCDALMRSGCREFTRCRKDGDVGLP